MIEYSLLKLLHLGALIFWLGPPLGAWLVLKVVEKETKLTDPVAARVSQVFHWMIILEHIAFAVLLTTGFMLALNYGLIGTEWLQQKLWIILLIVVPLEVVDVLLGNWIASRAARKLHSGQRLTLWENAGYKFYHGVFTQIALVAIPVSVVGIMYLAISKSSLELLLS